MIDFGFFREIFQSIGKNKLRTLLSGFTVAFAIMLFAILFGVANGLQNSFNSEFAEMQIIQFLYFLGELLRLLRGCR